MYAKINCKYLLCKLATLPYVFYYKFVWHWLKSFPTRHHIILFWLTYYPTVHVIREKVDECRFYWPSVANGMDGWSLYVVRPFYTCPATWQWKHITQRSISAHSTKCSSQAIHKTRVSSLTSSLIRRYFKLIAVNFKTKTLRFTILFVV